MFSSKEQKRVGKGIEKKILKIQTGLVKRNVKFHGCWLVSGPVECEPTYGMKMKTKYHNNFLTPSNTKH